MLNYKKIWHGRKPTNDWINSTLQVHSCWMGLICHRFFYKSLFVYHVFIDLTLLPCVNARPQLAKLKDRRRRTFVWPPAMATTSTCRALLKGPSRMVCDACVVRTELQVLSLSLSLSFSVWKKVGLPLALWQAPGPNFRWLPKVSGVATNHWVFLRCDWSSVSSWFFYWS